MLQPKVSYVMKKIKLNFFIFQVYGVLESYIFETWLIA